MKESTEPAPGPPGFAEVSGPVRSFLSRFRKAKRPVTTTSRKRRFLIRSIKVLVVIATLWLLAAYVVLPALWRHFEHHPTMEDAPRTSVTAQGIPGDPLNIALIGTEEGLIHAMLASGWKPADPITLRSSARIASSVLLNKTYADAPVSSLFVFRRRQDLAFEKAEGKSARHRHHVRFWKSEDLGRGGVPLWIGAVTFDRSVGFSHLTGQITHHIGPDIDTERDDLMADLRKGGWLTELFQVTGVGATLVGRNGGGDRYDTDGELTVGILVSGETRDHRPEELDNPVAVRVKEQLWTAIRPFLRSLPEQ